MNKRGLSAVIISMLLVLLAIVLVGVVWVAISGVVENSRQELEFGQRCLRVDVRPRKAECNDTHCDVSYKRKAGGGEIDGVRIVMTRTDEKNNSFADVDGSLGKLALRSEDNIEHNLSSNEVRIEVLGYLDHPSKEEKNLV